MIFKGQTKLHSHTETPTRNDPVISILTYWWYIVAKKARRRRRRIDFYYHYIIKTRIESINKARERGKSNRRRARSEDRIIL